MASRLQVTAGSLPIGGGAPVSVQSMTNTPTTDVEATRQQIQALAAAGAALVRVSVPDRASAEALPAILDGTPVPLAADIHFQPELALLSLDAGIHKLRLNPGNIRRSRDVARIAEKAGILGVPIRVGVNSGSVPGDIRERYGTGADAFGRRLKGISTSSGRRASIRWWSRSRPRTPCSPWRPISRPRPSATTPSTSESPKRVPLPPPGSEAPWPWLFYFPGAWATP